MSMTQVDRESSQSLFSQVEEIIRDGIENGVWLPGIAIPSERELSKMYNLSRMTVRKAIDRLATAGLLVRVNGKGTFVSQPKVNLKALSLAGLREQTINIGYSPSTSLIGFEKVLANQKIATKLQIEENEPVYLIERVMYGNNQPLGLHRSFIPIQRCAGLENYDLTTHSLYTVLRENFGIIIHRASETLETTLATHRESLLLMVNEGSPMFLLSIKMFDPDNQPIEYVKVIFRGDRVQLSLDL